ncbi:LytR/AlgR family response regulator transcription factor [Alteromonas sp. ASW11-130]|uniref:LytR/AlgR family response regulator transcription factor n=1 Tax=Alteromonas sp. ASW11-130 TaxID=3015775 RepID=UPI0022423B45|nr:LytTR family DNA-binding domain-containing protein [Alteromonas sp. ASW11-130]MCW8092798.1 LytTR family transcriptional regulator [Alteromonas sp. ASW11-130]
MVNGISQICLIAVQSQPVGVQLRQRLERLRVFDEVCLVLASTMPVFEEGHLTLFCDMFTWQQTSVLPQRIERLVLLGTNNHDALQAFAYNAFSFLTTPLVDEQLENVCVRLKQHQYNDEIVSHWRTIQHGLSQQLGISETAVSARILRFRDNDDENTLVLKTLTDTVFLAWQNIVKIEAEGDYMEVTTANEQLVIRSSLAALLKKLNNAHLIRISRSIAVNLIHVEKVFSDNQMNHYVMFKDNSVAKFSAKWFKQYRNRLH